MTIGIQWGDADSDWGGLIYLDAVTAFTRNHSGQVTKHPVDRGGNITDHFIRENDKITLSAVVSQVDLSTNVLEVVDENGYVPYNSKYLYNPVSVSSSDNSLLNKLMPASISQFVGTKKPEVTLDPSTPDYNEGVQTLLETLVSGERFNAEKGVIEPNIQLVSVYEFLGSLISKVRRDFVITSVAFNETADTGDGVYCEITLEKVRFVTLESTEIPKDVADSMKSKSASKSDKGKQDSTAKTKGTTGGPKPDADPLRTIRD